MKAHSEASKNKKSSSKRILSLLCAAAVLLSLSACKKGSDSKETDTTSDTSYQIETNAYAGTTVTGKVTEINQNTVTILIGELSESGDESRPDMPSAPQGNSDGSSSDNMTPPAKPDENGTGESGTSGAVQAPSGMPESGSSESGGTPPQMPSDSGNGMPSGIPGSSKTFTAGEETISFDISGASVVKDSETITADDISEGDILQVTFDESGSAKTVIVTYLTQSGANSGGPGGGSFGGSSEVTQGDSANTINENGSYSDKTYSSTGDDENALRIDGATVTLDGITVDKSAGATSNTENGDFYGVNAALLATNGATVTITNANVTSSAQNGNGVFSYGSGTTVNISDSTITTTMDNSGGIQTTGGGTTNASNLKVSSSGNSSAAIRSDRGGGTVNISGGSYTSNGYNSPAVYSTAEITVSGAELTANNSEALVIEGKNSIILENCTVTGNMSDTKGTSSDENVHNVMIYQSMSGDADVGTSVFSMTGGSLTSKNSDMFYITNTHCVMTLKGVQFVNEDSDSYLLRVVGNSASHGWGTAGSNGAQVELTADSQELDGNIIVDTISTLAMTLKNGSSFTGTINITDNAEGGTAVDDNAVVNIESGCTWNLTGDCTITSLENNGTINFNGYTITLSDGTVLK